MIGLIFINEGGCHWNIFGDAKERIVSVVLFS
jgi:hypothetical protein